MGVCTCKTGAGIRMVFASRARWECGASVRTPAMVLPEPECSRARVLCPHSRARVLFSVERLAGPRVRLACLVYNYVLVHALSPSVLLALALLPAKPTTDKVTHTSVNHGCLVGHHGVDFCKFLRQVLQYVRSLTVLLKEIDRF